MHAPLDYYATPGRHTDVQRFGVDVEGVDEAVRVVQGILVYDLWAKDLYGTELSDAQSAAVHERDAAKLLDLALTIDPRPLDQPREPVQRVGGRCHTYTLLTVALLRAVGIPARSRCGFATYFVDGYHEDHWVAEYWDASTERWRMVDAQLDDVWQPIAGLRGDGAIEVDRTQFVTGGHAWQAWRRGELDADRCGLTSIPEHGAFWIAGNLRLDFAALNKVEMLPWDVWGLGWEPGTEPNEDVLATFDEIATLTTDADRRFDELRSRYASDDELRVSGTVFSVALGEVQKL